MPERPRKGLGRDDVEGVDGRGRTILPSTVKKSFYSDGVRGTTGHTSTSALTTVDESSAWSSLCGSRSKVSTLCEKSGIAVSFMLPDSSTLFSELSVCCEGQYAQVRRIGCCRDGMRTFSS